MFNGALAVGSRCSECVSHSVLIKISYYPSSIDICNLSNISDLGMYVCGQREECRTFLFFLRTGGGRQVVQEWERSPRSQGPGSFCAVTISRPRVACSSLPVRATAVPVVPP